MSGDGSERKTLYIIDGHAQFFRAYHAIRSGMTSPVTKEPTNLTFGYVGMLIKLLREYTPDYLAVAIDVSGDTESFRSQMYPDYKKNRDAPPEDLFPQVDRCVEIMKLMEIPVLGQEGVEADDVIATLVTSLTEAHDDLEIYIVSRDKDLSQLVSDHVHLVDVHKDTEVKPADLFKVEGVEPRHVVDILALMGDTSDNVPGVPGIGPKTAAQLVLQYGSIEALYEHLDEIKGKRKERLEECRDQVPLAKRLVQLKHDVPVEFALEDSAVDPASLPVASILDVFSSLGFNQHRDQLQNLVEAARGGAPVATLPAGAEASTTSSAPAPPGDFGGLFDQSSEAQGYAAPSDATYTCVKSAAQLEELVTRLNAAERFAFDTETDSLQSRSTNLVGLSFSIDAHEAWYVPVRSPEPESHLDLESVLHKLGPVFSNTQAEVIAHNLKFDQNVLRNHGVELKARTFDTMIASYVIDSARSSHGMDALALGYLGHRCIPITELIGRGKNQRTFDAVPLADAAVYAAEDADITRRLYDVFSPKLDESGLRSLFDDLEMPLVEVIAELEYNGIRVDPDELKRQEARLQEQIELLRARIIEAAPHEFNPDSPKQLAAALFNAPDDDPPGLGLKVVKRGKTGPSTDVEVLEKLSSDPSVDSPVPELIVQYRQLTKLVNTYLQALRDAINPQTGRVHASFHQTVAATGRLSSSDPNLQNIPIRTEVGREIRRAFTAADGCRLLTADYSQIELRVLAHLSGDDALIEAFEAGDDIHRAVAAEVYGVSPGDVTHIQRHGAKMVNFGIVYGITPYGLARRLGDGVSVEEASRIITDYKARFSGIDGFLQDCVAQAESKGYVETMLGRRRSIPQIHASNRNERALGERMAINSVVQGSAADLIKLAMIDLHRIVTGEQEPPEGQDWEGVSSWGVTMVLQIHDELVFEMPEEHAASVRELVVGRMEGAMQLRVPLVVDAAVSENWIDAK